MQSAAPDQPQRLNLDIILQIVPINKKADRDLAIGAWNNYVEAFKSFDQKNSDATMINLIGRYANFTKVLRDLDDKYGGKR